MSFEPWLIAIAIKPLVALAVLVPGLMFARWLYKVMPDSRLKRVIFSPLPGHKPRRWG